MNRRDFFRRSAPLGLAALAPAVLLAKVPPARDDQGRLIVDGNVVELHDANVAGIAIVADQATIMNCVVNHGNEFGIAVRNRATS